MITPQLTKRACNRRWTATSHGRDKRSPTRSVNCEILQLRAKAKSELGEKFDIRAFHDQVLDSGALPLDVLAERINTWIASQK